MRSYSQCAPDDAPLLLVADDAADAAPAAAAAAVVHARVALPPLPPVPPSPPPLLARRPAMAAAHDGQRDGDQRDEGDEGDGDDERDQVLRVEPLLHHVLYERKKKEGGWVVNSHRQLQDDEKNFGFPYPNSELIL